ncbi:DNA-processing protein DprA, partial [Caulobacter sp. 17J65-9]|uniref:DNA-processing protein DprA n=1 Tax=Caulobacter sp. 17J65-9 TaxID=2709382 RepID=UPI0013C83B63|nr:DNA-protecting protein DprA [Caulobacter sp. 17J65-9]
MDRGERFNRLRLARTERVGPIAYQNLLSRFGSAGEALLRLRCLSARAPLAPPQPGEIEAELEAGEAMGARLLVLGDEDFPSQLAALDAPPPVLWTLGDAGLLARDACAVVGARIASSAGLRFARGLAAELGQAGLCVTSGMARGIDGAAHEGALPTGTVAVLAGGIDDVYPPEHDGLWARIREGGCIVAEQAPGVRAKAHDFPRRNRIISGLSRAVVVVEAELRSGSLITARLAAEQGREVLAVPGSPLEPRAKGTNDLIRQGAALCEGAEDVLRALAAPRTLREPDGRWDAAVPDAEVDAVRARVLDLLSPTAI